ncbi:hypothetical protein [Saccharicrinis aurantiacus]|uniref:hypothetical protein n=1 Tax=Saccharicrinis aurantiacus TaxID=1849719 RepID=UPI00248FF8C7|nr:hypothetical protein [Saccharicrinis aurantiacus]
MKIFKLSILIGFILIVGCSKDSESFNTYSTPSWAISSINNLPNSFTAIVGIPDNISKYASDQDMVSAFIGTECRGLGNLVEGKDSTKRVYYITVRASDTEDQQITFRYYNASLSYLYHANNTVAFESDATYGTFDNPVILELVQQ